MKRLFTLFLLVITFSMFSFAVELTTKEKEWIKKHPKIILGSDTNWSPYIIKNNDGIVIGYDTDILKRINEKTGANFQLTTGRWKDMLQKAKDKQIDGLSTSAVHEKRKEFFNFSNNYVSTQRLLVVSNTNPKKINSAKNLKNIRIGYQEKNLFDKKLVSRYKEVTAIPLKSLEEILDNLIKGKIDATIGSHAIIYLANKKNLPYIKIVDTISNSRLDLVFSVRKDYPEAISILNKGLDSISKNEKIKLHEKWFYHGQKQIEKENLVSLTKEEKNYLKQNSPLKIQSLKSFPPFNFLQNGTPSGYSVEYMKMMGKYLSIDIEFAEPNSFGKSIEMFKEDRIDILPHLAYNKTRDKFTDYTNFNHIKYSIGVTLRKDENINSFDDLKDKTIVVVKKSFIETFMKKNYPEQKLLSLSSTNASLEAVSSNRADAFIGSIPTMNYYIQKNWLNNIETVEMNIEGIPKKISMPMGVKEGNKILKSILEKVNLAIPYNEQIKLKEKWLNIKADDKNNLHLTESEKLYLKQKDEIKMCVLPNWLPFEQIDKNGKHKGVGADIIDIISGKIDKKIVLVPTTKWIKSLENIRDRKCDILPVVMDLPSRREVMNFTKPYTKEPFVIATKTDKIFIRDSSEIGNKKIGVVKSYAIKEILKEKNPGIEIVGVENAKVGLEKVQSGEIYGYIDIMSAIIYTMQQNSILDLKIAGKLEFDIELSIASRNDEPLLNSIMQKSLDTIDDDGIKKIVGKWLSIKIEEKVDYSLLIQISIVFIIIILIVLYKNRQVKNINQKVIEQQEMVDKHVMILATDLLGKITYVNYAFCQKIGYVKDELIGKNHKILKHPDMKPEVFRSLWNNITNGKIWHGEIQNLTKDKESIYCQVVIEPVIENGRKVGYRSISDDITDKKRIEELSITDKLTNLFNRVKLDEVLDLELQRSKRYNHTFGVILIDIDYFKSVNDNYGHQVGDQVLQEIAKILKEHTRNLDIVGRWGGEEFLIICPETDYDGIIKLSETLRNLIEIHDFSIVKKKTASFGVSIYNNDENVETIIKRADDALYKAKENGRNRIESL